MNFEHLGEIWYKEKEGVYSVPSTIFTSQQDSDSKDVEQSFFRPLCCRWSGGLQNPAGALECVICDQKWIFNKLMVYLDAYYVNQQNKKKKKNM